MEFAARGVRYNYVCATNEDFGMSMVSINRTQSSLLATALNKARKPLPIGRFDSKNAPRLWNHFAQR